MRRAAKVDRNHVQIVELLRSKGFSVLSIAAIGRGAPDIVLAKDGATWLAEIKDGHRLGWKLTDDQRKFHANWKAPILIFDSVETVEMWVKTEAAVVKKKVDELEGAELDYWVAKAEGVQVRKASDGWNPNVHWEAVGEDSDGLYVPWSPSSSWLEAGPIIEREGINVAEILDEDGKFQRWGAIHRRHIHVLYSAETPLVAAMRCYVGSKFGEEVEVKPLA